MEDCYTWLDQMCDKTVALCVFLSQFVQGGPFSANTKFMAGASSLLLPVAEPQNLPAEVLGGLHMF